MWIWSGRWRFRRRIVIRFDIEGFRKQCLINGWDEIGLAARHVDKIRAYEAARAVKEPWLLLNSSNSRTGGRCLRAGWLKRRTSAWSFNQGQLIQ